jgi:type I restriction enzyme M protein
LNIKSFISCLGFLPKENATDIFNKKYTGGYFIEIDFKKENINYGKKIKSENKTTQNFSQEENWVVLECVNRLLEKGYKPENIILEKTWGAGHGTSGRLDICVTRDDGSEYLLIECKTWGKEFDKEFTRMKKDGGQLFTYFKFSNKPDIIMLYASELKGKQIVFRNEIVKIEDDYRTGDVKDFYEKWSKLTKNNGVFDNWVKSYNFESKALTVTDLEEIRQEDSSFIFNRFLEILRHNVVSDKGNAFNRIFTLFLCKIYDEKTNEGTDNELGFQWLEGIDNHRSFQLRLTDLYKSGMHEFLEKVVTDFSETEFKNRFPFLSEEQRNPILEEFRKIRLEKNNEFAIKDVYDEQSFNENAVVVKEIVELLQGYKLRYTKKQQYLSDFFELLLTTGLKQESGQFFTPVPVAQFVIKSLPIDTILEQKLATAKIDNDTLLPYVMDYAAGSGHFLTETMHEIQRLLDKKDDKKYHPSIAKKLRNWKDDHFTWAIQYIYGIEKDYRLVKVGKVGCYLHGDGLANVIHSDGLAYFGHQDYKGKLLTKDRDFPKENKQFDIIVSNPPYSVSAFKNAARQFYKENDFELYNKLTDNSSEIECLFIERTKQLLKDGGVAGIILPSSILSNTGIYSKSREIILQYFDIIGIAELGSNTFMATGTNTVTLFLRRRNNYESANLKIAVEKFFTTLQDVTLNGIEKPATKYVNHVWEGISFDDYISLLKKIPNKAITEHEIYIEYKKKIKAKNDKEFWGLLLEKETDKLYYFIIAYPQKVVLIKSGEKDAEKRFLGYEFSNRRGSEGIHPMQRGKNIEDCTQLFDPEIFDNPIKASTYIYKAFAGDYDFPIDAAMQNNISRHNLVDMLTFDRVDFEKNISLSAKKKVKIETKWELKKLGEICEVFAGGDVPEDRFSKKISKAYHIPIYSNGIDNDGLYGYTNEPRVTKPCITISARGTIGFTKIRLVPFYPIVRLLVLIPDKKIANVKYLEVIANEIEFEQYAVGTPQLTVPQVSQYKIPLPPKGIQEKIVAEIEDLEVKEMKAKGEVEELLKNSVDLINRISIYSKEPISKLFEINSKTINPKELWENEFFTYVDIDSLGKGDGKVSFNQKLLGKDAPSRARRFADNNTAIISTVRPYLKGFAYIDKVPEKTIFSTGFALLNSRDENKFLTKLVYYLFMFSSDLMKQMESAMPKSAYPSINKEDIDNFKIPLPSVSEQKKIVSEIEKMETKIKALESEIALIPQQKEAVLKKYL